MLILSDLLPVDPLAYSYASRLEDGAGMTYPHGEGWTGREVGQRTLPCLTPDAPVAFERSILYPTKESILDRLAIEDLGFSELPTWMNGSARTYTLNFPDTALWHAIADLFYLYDPTPLLKSARLSPDATLGLDTGPASPRVRQLYWLDGTFSSLGQPLQSGTEKIRCAASYWDFATAWDPVYISLEDNSGIIFRNLSALKVSASPMPTGLTQGFYDVKMSAVSGLTGEYIEDSEIAVIWSGDRSESDTQYLPAVRALGPAMAGYDLGAGLTYPIPSGKELLTRTSTVPSSWGSSLYLFGVTPSGNINNYFLTRGLPETSYEISVSGGVLGRAYPIDGSNGWDRAGEFIQTGRRIGESDIKFASRQQKIWITGLETHCSGSPGRSNRVLSSYFGLTQIITWQGQTVTLPNACTGFDLLTTFESPPTLYASRGDLIELTTAGRESAVSPSQKYEGGLVSGAAEYLSTGSRKAFYCREDLSCYQEVRVTVGPFDFLPGRDYLLSSEDSSIILFRRAVPLSYDIRITLGARQFARLVLEEDFSPWTPGRDLEKFTWNLLPAGYHSYVESFPLRDGRTQISDSGFTPISVISDSVPGLMSPAIITSGPKVSSVALRQILSEDRVTPTAFGQRVLTTTARYSWSDFSRPSRIGARLD